MTMGAKLQGCPRRMKQKRTGGKRRFNLNQPIRNRKILSLKTSCGRLSPLQCWRSWRVRGWEGTYGSHEKEGKALVFGLLSFLFCPFWGLVRVKNKRIFLVGFLGNCFNNFPKYLGFT